MHAVYAIMPQYALEIISDESRMGSWGRRKSRACKDGSEKVVMPTTTATSTFTQFSVSPVTPRIGAEIGGIDLASDLPQETIDEIYQALLTYKVIFFRDQDITQEQHIAFARRFGDLEIHPSTPKDQSNPEVFHLRPVSWDSNGGSGDRKMRYGADLWHSDVTWREKPSLGSVLRSRVIPEVGGDTLWSDQVAAYEGLSPAMKEWVCSLTAIHDGSVFAKAAAERGTTFDAVIPEQEHPVVRTHPDTGERALYVNCASPDASRG